MVEEIRARGLMLIPDAHFAATPPGQRLEGFLEHVLTKVRACLEHAEEHDFVPVFLGDLFHWPRENPNALLVALIELFRLWRPFVLVGNHDKYQARYTQDVSLAVLEAAGAARVLGEPGPALALLTPQGRVLVGASPDGAPIPHTFDRGDEQWVVWLTHHNINFPDYDDKPVRLREIPGVDWVINGHLHRPQPIQVVGGTRWANPGNITRLTFSRRTMERTPAASIWLPGAQELERFVVPHLPFAAVFPDQELPPEEETGNESESLFLHGLERLAWRRTAEGAGLREFLMANVNPELPEARLVWELYQEVVRDDAK